MKLPNWMMLCVLLLGAMGQYSINAVASTPAYSGGFEHSNTHANIETVSQLDEISIDPVNINTANAEELSGLPGIGTKKAVAIVEYRKLNGEFLSVEEIVNVNGIGPKMLAKLDGYIRI